MFNESKSFAPLSLTLLSLLKDKFTQKVSNQIPTFHCKDN